MSNIIPESPPGPAFVFPRLDVQQLESDRKDQATAVDTFGRNIIAELQKEKPNVLISALSIHEALMMTANGALGDTLTCMKTGLCLKNPSSDEPINVLHAQVTAGATMENRAPLYTLANSIWISDKLPIYRGFVDECSSVFQADAKTLDLSKKDCTDTINKWVVDATKGLIEKVVDDIHPQTRLVLVNAIHFQQKFDKPFKKPLTRERDFRLFGGGTKKVEMMKQTETMAYFNEGDVEGVILQFELNDAQMVVMLPKEEGLAALHKVASTWLAGDQFSRLIDSSKPGRIELQLPKFEIGFEGSLKPVLIKLGMEKAFSDTARFPRISETDLKIDDVVHKAKLRVDEDGVEAAAATGVTMMPRMFRPEPDPIATVVVDRPFVVGLMDRRDKLLFFSGVVSDLGV